MSPPTPVRRPALLRVPARALAAALTTLLLAACGADAPPPAVETADVVLYNANVVTMDPAQPQARAVATRGDRILAVGSDAEVRALAGEDTRQINLHGHTLVPGLIDAHVHFVGIGMRLLRIDASRATDKQDIVAMVAESAAVARPGDWILGRGWDQNKWPVKTFPTAADLDAVAPDNPVYLGRVDGHAGWANSVALEIAGISAESPDPSGGQIIRDANGVPTGTLIDNAFRLVTRFIPPPSREMEINAIQLAIQEALSRGVTSVQEAGGNWGDIEIYAALMETDAFNLRIFEFIRWPRDEQAQPHSWDELDEMLAEGPQVGLHDNRLTIGGIKMSIDGALGSRGAALLAPYADDPDNHGLFRLDQEEIQETIRRGLEGGFQITTHAIGDAANRVVLDAMEAAIAETGARDHRMRIEHAQILDAADLPRFAELGITPSMQPTHATTDMHWAEDRLGADRVRYAYAWKSLLDSGVRIVGGSDAPVEPLDPLAGFHAAVTRQDADGWPDGGWHPEQRVSREQALAMFTRDAAWSVFEEDLKGTLSPGKLADMVVLSGDIMSVPEDELLDVEVLMTWLGGEVRYENRALKDMLEGAAAETAAETADEGPVAEATTASGVAP
ncbi:MAG TPA: amidohydrolase [Pseudomonadales bacterium]|nr:amidohydrolase [Pseudomonadales bacterium]